MRSIELMNFGSCKQSENNEMKYLLEAAKVEILGDYDTPQTGTSDGERKFLRTADLKFKVKDVSKATESIETITYQCGGFVTHTRLSSDIIQSNITSISKDSYLETTYYSVTN